jgi:hypothetical protein
MKIVQICGGLGCQIIDYATYHVLSTDGQCYVDVSYYRNITGRTEGRPWDLSTYCGIDLASLPEAPLSEERIRKEMRKSLRATVDHEPGSRSAFARYRDLVRSKCDAMLTRLIGVPYVTYLPEGSCPNVVGYLKSPEARALFAPTPEVSANARRLALEACGHEHLDVAVHVRQGDYLSQASKIVSVEQNIHLLGQISSVVFKAKRHITWISDSELDRRLVENGLPSFRHSFLIGGDPLAVHVMMTNAAFLVAANSTYSFTAGLLSGQPFFAPCRWYGDKAKYLDCLRNRHLICGIF